MVSSKKKELKVQKILKYWIGFFGCPKRIFVDKMGKFASDALKKLRENFNIMIYTTATKNGLIERHNAVLGLTVTKTIEVKCDLDMAVAWTISATNSLNNVNRGMK